PTCHCSRRGSLADRRHARGGCEPVLASASRARDARFVASNSYFLVYFAGKTTIADAQRALEAQGVAVVRDGDGLTARWHDGPAFYIGLSDEPHVRLEAEDVAERQEVAPLASCSRRFEVAFDDLEEVLQEYNTLFVLQVALQELTGGYIHL